MNRNFYKEAFGFAVLSWKRMLPGLSDTIVALVFGVLVLKVASVVLIAALTFNIALGSFCSLTMLHCQGAYAKERILGVLFRAASLVGFLYLILGVLAVIVFETEIGTQSFLFLALSVFRPFLIAWNTFSSETLIREGKRSSLQRQTTYSVTIYATTTWLVLGAVYLAGASASILWLLIGIYTTQAYTSVASYRKISVENRIRLRDYRALLKYIGSSHRELKETRAAVSNALANVMELGFLTLCGWLVVSKFPAVSEYYFPLFNMFEWGSGLALGISRMYTQRRINKGYNPPYSLSLLFFAIYAAVFATGYLWLMGALSTGVIELSFGLVAFSFCYLFADGAQLILRSYAIARPDGGSLLKVSTRAYVASVTMLGISYVLASQVLFFLSLILPLVVIAITISDEVRKTPEPGHA